MNFRYSKHAERELEVRRIPRSVADDVLLHPQQIVTVRDSKKAYQARIDFGDGRLYLVRVIVDDTVKPAMVVTVYRTSKIEKYWEK